MVNIISGKYSRQDAADVIVMPDVKPMADIDKSKWSGEDTRRQYYQALSSGDYSHRSKRFLQKLKSNQIKK